ncbi:MAG: dolichol monophosphate mannose synthase [Verrucomicrobia bacterium RIFCSPHIGHO2_12_FULL_41_10]|nr:MAG: dolichol monophosphate mannose synthase [Verrucomicrobia bacterium RIFCSPHIGHO2_12_FULL_41_10]
MKTISIITACYNEEANVKELYERVRAVMARIGRYRYEHIFIDNHSEDNTVAILKKIAEQDKNIRIIVNSRNFGHIRSPMHALGQAQGDAVIGIVADFQDPPELIPDLISAWEEGYKMVLGVKESSAENKFMYAIRKYYYRFIKKISSIPTFENATGFGLFDRQVIDIIKSFKDPYPYFRGMIAEIGLPCKLIPYHQPERKHGKTKNNFYSLYDMAMLGITNFSKIPLRMSIFLGFISAIICLLTAIFYFVYKLLFWNSFTIGEAPIIIGVFLFSSIQLIALGILGEYIGSIQTYVQARPYVVEQERVNFEFEPGMPLTEKSKED